MLKCAHTKSWEALPSWMVFRKSQSSVQKLGTFATKVQRLSSDAKKTYIQSWEMFKKRGNRVHKMVKIHNKSRRSSSDAKVRAQTKLKCS